MRTNHSLIVMFYVVNIVLAFTFVRVACAQSMPKVCIDAMNAHNNNAPPNICADLFTQCLNTGKLAPEDQAIAYVNRGSAYRQLKQFQRAIDDFEKAITRAPRFAIAWHSRGSVYSELGQHERAIEDYTAAIRFQPDLAGAYLNRANSYKALGKIDKAREDAKRAHSLDPKLKVSAF